MALGLEVALESLALNHPQSRVKAEGPLPVKGSGVTKLCTPQ